MKRIAIVGKRETMTNENYYAAVEACGAKALTIELSGGIHLIRDSDGVIIPGGVDINPSLYHEKNSASREIDDSLDRLELDVICEAVKYRKPILGICRGLQILNVYFGGSLTQNIERCDIHEREGQKDKVHIARVIKDSFLYDVYGEEIISINSAHHQAVKELGKGLIAAQFSDDGIMEAFYHTELPIYAVQWHPERMCLKNARSDTVNGLKVFEYFINGVSKRKVYQ